MYISKYLKGCGHSSPSCLLVSTPDGDSEGVERQRRFTGDWKCSSGRIVFLPPTTLPELRMPSVRDAGPNVTSAVETVQVGQAGELVGFELAADARGSEGQRITQMNQPALRATHCRS